MAGIQKVGFDAITTMLLLATACLNSYAQPTMISGTIKGIQKEPIQIWYTKDGKRHVDTIYAQNDQFRYQVASSDDSTLIIYIAKPPYSKLWLGEGPVSVSGTFQDPSKLRVTGGFENKLLDQYNSEIEWVYDELVKGKPDSVKTVIEKERREKTIAFIRANPGSRTAAVLLYWQSMYYEEDIETYDSLFPQFRPELRASKQGIQLSDRLQTLRNQPMPGKIAPEFTLPDMDEKSVSLGSFKGKYVLLDFWGHWCSPCVRAFPALKTLKDRYSNKIQIVGVAAEHREDRDKWVKMIKTNGLSWVQLSEFKAGEGVVNNTYNITGFPTYFLLDQAGTIISKSNSLEDIEKKLATIAELN